MKFDRSTSTTEETVEELVYALEHGDRIIIRRSITNGIPGNISLMFSTGSYSYDSNNRNLYLSEEKMRQVHEALGAFLEQANPN